jgi:hypothetical protein
MVGDSADEYVRMRRVYWLISLRSSSSSSSLGYSFAVRLW